MKNYVQLILKLFFENVLAFMEVQNYRVTKSSYKTELRKMTLHFELLTRKFYRNLPFELLTRLDKILNQTSSY